MRAGSASSDRALVHAAQAGDTAAAAELLRRYDNIIRLLAHQFFDPTGDHQDLIQEARIGALKAVRDYKDGRAGFKTFLWFCVRRHLITHVKTAAKQKHGILTTATRITVDDEGEEAAIVDMLPNRSDPAETLHGQERFRAVVTVIREQLSERERAAVIGFYFNGEHYNSERRIDNALQRAKVKLRRALEPLDEAA